MFRILLRILFFLLVLPIKLPWMILFNRSYRDKALLYSWERSAFELENTEDWATSFSMRNVTFPMSGGGMLGRRGRLIIEGSGGGGGAVKRDGDHLLSTGGGQGRLSLGLLPNKGKGLRIYPIIGVGGAGSGLTVKHDDGSTILNSGLGDATYHIGLAIDFIVGWRLGLIVGVRVGLESPIISKRTTPFMRFNGGIGWFGKDVESNPNEQPTEEPSKIDGKEAKQGEPEPEVA